MQDLPNRFEDRKIRNYGRDSARKTSVWSFLLGDSTTFLLDVRSEIWRLTRWDFITFLKNNCCARSQKEVIKVVKHNNSYDRESHVRYNYLAFMIINYLKSTIYGMLFIIHSNFSISYDFIVIFRASAILL